MPRPVTRSCQHLRATLAATPLDRAACTALVEGRIGANEAYVVSHVASTWNPVLDPQRTRFVLTALLAAPVSPDSLRVWWPLFRSRAWRAAVDADGRAARSQVVGALKVYACVRKASTHTTGRALVAQLEASGVKRWRGVLYRTMHALCTERITDAPTARVLTRMMRATAASRSALALEIAILDLCDMIRRHEPDAALGEPWTRHVVMQSLQHTGGHRFGALCTRAQTILGIVFAKMASFLQPSEWAAYRRATVHLVCAVDDDLAGSFAALYGRVCGMRSHPEMAVQIACRRGVTPRAEVVEHLAAILGRAEQHPRAALLVARALPDDWRVRRQWDATPRLDELMLRVAAVTGDVDVLSRYAGWSGGSPASRDQVRSVARWMRRDFVDRCARATTVHDLQLLTRMPIADVAAHAAAVERVMSQVDADARPTCMITQEPIVCPAHDGRGMVFEEDAIRRWIARHGTHPIRRDDPMHVCDLAIAWEKGCDS